MTFSSLDDPASLKQADNQHNQRQDQQDVNKPPNVYGVTSPKSHITSRITKIVQSMVPFSFEEFFDCQNARAPPNHIC